MLTSEFTNVVCSLDFDAIASDTLQHAAIYYNYLYKFSFQK